MKKIDCHDIGTFLKIAENYGLTTYEAPLELEQLKSTNIKGVKFQNIEIPHLNEKYLNAKQNHFFVDTQNAQEFIATITSACVNDLQQKIKILENKNRQLTNEKAETDKRNQYLESCLLKVDGKIQEIQNENKDLNWKLELKNKELEYMRTEIEHNANIAQAISQLQNINKMDYKDNAAKICSGILFYCYCKKMNKKFSTKAFRESASGLEKKGIICHLTYFEIDWIRGLFPIAYLANQITNTYFKNHLKINDEKSLKLFDYIISL